jgi:nickel transport protein
MSEGTKNMKPMKHLSILVLALVLCMALAPIASAHRVIVQGRVSEIQIKAYFGGGDATPMADANVEIYAIRDGQEELYLTGKADADGMYYFPPKIGVSEYRAVVEESGHKGEETVNLAEGAGLAETEQEEEGLPLTQMIAGFGYLAGLAGIAMILTARKMKKRYENK